MLTTYSPQVPILREATLQAFRNSLSGHLYHQGDEGYDEARKVWNGAINRRPALIVRCTTVTDVIRSVRFARDHDLLVSVRGGGHNVSGYAVFDGALMIDLSEMKSVRVEPEARTATVEAGATAGDLIRATERYGLVTPVGTNSQVGIAGLTLGGGIGWLMGKHGLTLDNLLEAEVVTADGQLLRASTTEHPDLFWAIRGGGGNFGIVTSFTFRLHPVGTYLVGAVIHQARQAREVLHFYQEFTHDAPDELVAYAMLTSAPGGQPALAVSFCYAGPLAEGERIVEPMRRFGTPVGEMIRPTSYLDLISMYDKAAPAGRSYYEKGSTLTRLSDKVITIISDYGRHPAAPYSSIRLQHVHGAAARVSPGETAAGVLRGEQYSTSIGVAWESGSGKEGIEWADALCGELARHATGGIYVNSIGNEGEEHVRAAYRDNYLRLVAIKNRYDPTNFFRLNQNIKPFPLE